MWARQWRGFISRAGGRGWDSGPAPQPSLSAARPRRRGPRGGLSGLGRPPAGPRQLTTKQEAAFGYRPHGLGSRAQDKIYNWEGKLPIKWKSSQETLQSGVASDHTAGCCPHRRPRALPAPYLALAPGVCGDGSWSARAFSRFHSGIKISACLQPAMHLLRLSGEGRWSEREGPVPASLIQLPGILTPGGN